MSEYNKQVYWSLFLVAFFCATWFHSLYKYIIRVITNDYLVLFAQLPKVSEEECGHVIDIFRFKNRTYCPVENLMNLTKLNASRGSVDENIPIFRLDSCAFIDHKLVNNLLKTLLLPFFPQMSNCYKCHSFRAAVPAFMASHPELFSIDESMVAGRWQSDV